MSRVASRFESRVSRVCSTVTSRQSSRDNIRESRVDSLVETLFDSLLAAKKIIVTAEDKTVIHAVGNFDEGCRIVALSTRFGLPGVSDCKACDRCHGTPVAKMAAAAKTKVDTDISNENKASPVLKRLESMCLVCRSHGCDGEGCLGRNKCFKCGGPHYSKDCSDFDFTSLLHSRACFSCLDLHSRREYQTHDKGMCPLKKRLRRVFIEAWRTCPGTSSPTTFVSFVTSIMCDKEHFYRFLATRSADVLRTKSNTTNNK